MLESRDLAATVRLKLLVTSISLRLGTESPTTSTAAGVYQLAGRRVLSNRLVPQLAAFRSDEESGELAPVPTVGRPLGTVYRGPGWLGQAWREVQCSRGPSGYLITVGGDSLEMSVDREGRCVAVGGREAKAAPPSELVMESVLGPGLILALALGGTWCLHASAVEVDGCVFVFAGESGVGKSTLARSLEEVGERRIADDVLPLEWISGNLVAWPRFPQLKLPSAGQPSMTGPESLPVAAVLIVSPAPAEEPAIERLNAAEATLALARHTVASRLFDREPLSEHLRFCADVAASGVATYRLLYPHRADAPTRVRDLLRKLCRQLVRG